MNPETLTTIFVVVILFAAMLGLFFVLAKKYFQDSFEKISDKAMSQNVKNVIDLAKSELSHEKDEIKSDLMNKQDAIEKLVKNLQTEINDRQKEIRIMEENRNKSYGDISRSIDEHRKLTSELKVSTEGLQKLLSTNQVRGEWGERIIEQILEEAGLIKNIHYLSQTFLPNSQAKPDITLKLPDNRFIAIDVKFPYSAIQKMAQTDSLVEKKEQEKIFRQDVNEKMKQIIDRGYIDTDNGTLDYAIMFVPNETLFSYINNRFPEIIDLAFKKRVLIVSPFSLFAVTRMLLESYKNFTIENNLKEILGLFGEFGVQWGKFKDEFAKFDKSIKGIRDSYDQINKTRFKEMDRRVKKIESHSIGKIEEKEVVELISEGV